MKQKTERGAADIRIELRNGRITIYHCDGGAELAVLYDAPEGTWNKMWECFELLGIEPKRKVSSMPLHSEAAWENYREVG
jgi:hypothetical protein